MKNVMKISAAAVLALALSFGLNIDLTKSSGSVNLSSLLNDANAFFCPDQVEGNLLYDNLWSNVTDRFVDGSGVITEYALGTTANREANRVHYVNKISKFCIAGGVATCLMEGNQNKITIVKSSEYLNGRLDTYDNSEW